MSATRVFHIPSHLSYAIKLRGRSFHPVPSPTPSPMRVADLLAATSWEFFDTLHLHTVELATLQELRSLADRLDQLGKPLVVTVHDLCPNIEDDAGAFRRKLALVLERAATALTLTPVAADRLKTLTGISCLLEIVPHGRALASEALPGSTMAGPGGGFAIFGALRTNRDLRSAVAAWRSLSSPRPQLRVLLRSVSAADRSRDARLLQFLEHVARSEKNCTVEAMPGVMPDEHLVAWLAGAAVLVLPYRLITHSGQLELACDLGIPVLAPDEATLRDQLATNGREGHPVAWFPSDALGTTGFGDHLMRAMELPRPAHGDQLSFQAFRRAEHARLVGAHAAFYRRSRSRSAV